MTEAYIQRMHEEAEQLDERIHKLEAFTSSLIFDNLHDIIQSLLAVQLGSMKLYRLALGHRIKLAHEPAAKPNHETGEFMRDTPAVSVGAAEES